VDDRRFDELTRQVGLLALPRLPRRGVLGLLGGATLAGALGIHPAAAAQCKDEGKKCDKNKCKKKNKKCCCNDLKCKNGRCEPKGGSCKTDVGNGTEFPAFNASSGPDEFSVPFGITTDLNGNVYVTDTGNERVLVFSANGTLIDEFGAEGQEDEDFQEPLGIAFGEDNDGNDRLYIADPGMSSTSRRFRKFRLNGTHEENLGESSLTDPTGVAVDADGNIWVVDRTGAGEVFLFDDSGNFVDSFSPGGSGALDAPEGIGTFEENNRTFVYVADTGKDRIVKFEFVGGDLDFVDAAGSTGTQNDRFNEPVGIAIDKCGNLWVADRENDRIQQLDKDLNFESRFGDGFNEPTGVALSPNGKSLYVVDSLNERVIRYPLS
jgi:DNA-binding beta-propeller fold protein YncE